LQPNNAIKFSGAYSDHAGTTYIEIAQCD